MHSKGINSWQIFNIAAGYNVIMMFKCMCYGNNYDAMNHIR